MGSPLVSYVARSVRIIAAYSGGRFKLVIVAVSD